MIRAVTQVLIGLMLVFATVTLIPRAIVYMRFARKGRGFLYIFLGALAALFAIAAFGYAYTIVVGE